MDDEKNGKQQQQERAREREREKNLVNNINNANQYVGTQTHVECLTVPNIIV